MKTVRTIKGTFIIAALLIVIAGHAFAAETFNLDPTHTSAVFKVKHLGLTYVTGGFTDISGVINLDRKNAAASNVTVTIKTTSVNTNVGMRDNDLRSGNFFDVAKYPEMTFKSKKVVKVNDKSYKVTGDFTMHGVTKSITVKVNFLGETAKDPWGKHRAAFDAAFSIKRSDYGMGKMVPLVGDKIDITFTAEAVK